MFSAIKNAYGGHIFIILTWKFMFPDIKIYICGFLVIWKWFDFGLLIQLNG